MQPTYLLSVGWSGTNTSGQATTGTVEVDNFQPLMHGRPCVLAQAHGPVVKEMVMGRLAALGIHAPLDNMSVVNVWRWEE